MTREAYYALDPELRTKVTIVRTVDEARVAVAALYRVKPGTVHACDTEVMDIDLKVTAFYCGRSPSRSNLNAPTCLSGRGARWAR